MGLVQAGFVGFEFCCLGSPLGTLVHGFTIGTLVQCFDLLFSVFHQLWLSWIFFFSDVMHFFSNGEEEELTEVFHRLWLSLFFFFFKCRGCFFQREKGKEETEVS